MSELEDILDPFSHLSEESKRLVADTLSKLLAAENESALRKVTIGNYLVQAENSMTPGGRLPKKLLDNQGAFRNFMSRQDRVDAAVISGGFSPASSFGNKKRAKVIASVFHIEGSEYFEVHTPFNLNYTPDLIVLFKTIHYKDRYWKKEDRRWGFLRKYFPVVTEWIKSYYEVEYYSEVLSEEEQLLNAQANLVDTILEEARGNLADEIPLG